MRSGRLSFRYSTNLKSGRIVRMSRVASVVVEQAVAGLRSGLGWWLMSSEDKAGLVVLFRGLAVGLGFVWLFGFAIGYQGWSWVACWVLAGLAVGSLVVASKFDE